MAVKFDGVIEAARYAPDGNLLTVRAYVRRGATFSDHILINREALVERLKKGKKFVTGQRTENMASTFKTLKAVQLTGSKGQEVISTSAQTDRDLLEEVPLF
jgi:hypothetical protein